MEFVCKTEAAPAINMKWQVLLSLKSKQRCRLLQFWMTKSTWLICLFIIFLASAHSAYFENKILLKPVLVDICSLGKYITVYEETFILLHYS